MKAGVIVFPGTNCDIDTKRACELFNWETEYIWHDQNDLMGYDVVFLPGGFSYGDYIRAGRLAKFSPAVQSLKEYVNKKRGFVIGICNGFQILCETKLLPGALSVNSSTRFICQEEKLKVNHPEYPEEISLPIAHGEGRYIASQDVIDELIMSNSILFRYKNDVNGSIENIAGIYDRENKIIGMMPHPERAVFKETGNCDGQYFFKMIEAEF
jgi:phosphoribosylformylglycinamidine synthase subunit PurQ / glutaminase